MDIQKNIDITALAENIFNHYNSLEKKSASIILYNCGDLGELVADSLVVFLGKNNIKILIYNNFSEASQLQDTYRVNVKEIIKYPLEFVLFHYPRSVREMTDDIL